MRPTPTRPGSAWSGLGPGSGCDADLCCRHDANHAGGHGDLPQQNGARGTQGALGAHRRGVGPGGEGFFGHGLGRVAGGPPARGDGVSPVPAGEGQGPVWQQAARPCRGPSGRDRHHLAVNPPTLDPQPRRHASPRQVQHAGSFCHHSHHQWPPEPGHLAGAAAGGREAAPMPVPNRSNAWPSRQLSDPAGTCDDLAAAQSDQLHLSLPYPCTAQGIWMCEHRNHGGSRRLVVTIQGE